MATEALTRNPGIRSWNGQTLTTHPVPPRETAPAQTFNVAHVNGCVVIGKPKNDLSVLHAQPLSNRETEVLALAAEGNGNKEIGVTLHISERTVKNHLRGITSKLHASDRTDAVVTAIRLGWLAI